MRIVLLGAQGMLGQALHDVFVPNNNVVAWDKNDLDITNENEVRAKLFAFTPEIVINAAAYTDVDGAEGNRDQAFAVNEAGVSNVAKAAKDLGAKMIHFSTDYVFSGEETQGYGENDPPGPSINAYGESKLAGERLLKEISPNFYLIRTAWLYGAGGKNFVDTMVRLGRQQLKQGESKPALTVVNDQWGNPTYTMDLAETCRKLVDEDFDTGIYHLVNDGITTWYDLAKRIFEFLSWEVEVVPVSSAQYIRPAKRPRRSVLLTENSPKMRSWEKALAEYLREGMITGE